jgi:hypothetical protein
VRCVFIWHRFFPLWVIFRHRKDKFRTLLPYRNTLKRVCSPIPAQPFQPG